MRHDRRMSEVRGDPIVHAVLSDYIVADGDVERPMPGVCCAVSPFATTLVASVAPCASRQ